MKDVKVILILFLAGVIAFLILTDRDPPAVDVTPYRTQIAIADLKIDSLSKGNKKLARKIAEDSILRAEQSAEHIQIVQKMHIVIDRMKANPKVITIRAENSVIDSLIIAQDSLIESQGKRIHVLEGDVKTLGIDLQAVTENFEAQLSATQIKLKATEDLAAAYKKDLRKQRRKTKLATVLIPVAVVGVLLLAQ